MRQRFSCNSQVDWIEGFYNLERMHSSIDNQTPAAVESSLMAA